MNDLIVPDSLRTYYQDKAVKAAVDDLMGQVDGEKMPVEGWAEQRAYHQALLMAAKVRADFAQFSFDLHHAVWGDFKGFRLEDNEGFSPSEIWDDGEIGRDFWFDESEESFARFGIHIRETTLVVFALLNNNDAWQPFDASDVPDGWINAISVKDWNNGTYSSKRTMEDIIENPMEIVEAWKPGARQLVEAFREKQE